MNKVMLIGIVTKEPDVRYFDVDQAVAKVRLATKERGYVAKNGTKVPDHTDWHNLVFFGPLAKIVEDHVHEGDKLYVEGRLRYSSYEDKSGTVHNQSKIMVENMELLSPKQQ